MNADGLSSRAQVHDKPLDAVPARLIASWQRSESYGVSLDDIRPSFSGTYDDDSLFFECGREVLSGLHTTLSSEPVGLMLTDADGLVLNRLSGDAELLRTLDEVHLAPGFTYSERDAGTNGLGLALADRVPALVRAQDHYALSLCGYTCAAAPVFDPVTGRLEGAINLTTWSDARSDLLLALAQTAASSTANLMLARSHGSRPLQAAKGHVFRVEPLHEPVLAASRRLSDAWTGAVDRATAAVEAGRVVAAVGEGGSGRATLLAEAHRRGLVGHRLLAVRAPEPHDIDTWLSFWTPELAREHTSFVISNVDELPASGAERLADLLRPVAASSTRAIAVSAEQYDAIPPALAALVDTVVQVPPLRERAADILPLADEFARRARGRSIDVAPAAARALTDFAWPGNVEQLRRVVKDAATRTDVIDVHHLPPEVLAQGERLPRIRAFERDEIVRVLARPGVTIEEAANELGMSRATVYRKIAQYGIQVPRVRAD